MLNIIISIITFLESWFEFLINQWYSNMHACKTISSSHILPTNFCIDRNDLIKMMTVKSKKSYVMFSSMATTRTTSTEKCVSISNKWLEALKMGLSHDQWAQWAIILKRRNKKMSKIYQFQSFTWDFYDDWLKCASLSLIWNNLAIFNPKFLNDISCILWFHIIGPLCSWWWLEQLLSS